MARFLFGDVEEEVVTREEFPLEKAREVLKDEVSRFSGTACRVRLRRSTCAITASK